MPVSTDFRKLVPLYNRIIPKTVQRIFAKMQAVFAFRWKALLLMHYALYVAVFVCITIIISIIGSPIIIKYLVAFRYRRKSFNFFSVNYHNIHSLSFKNLCVYYNTKTLECQGFLIIFLFFNCNR